MKRPDLHLEFRSDPKLLSCVRALTRRYLEDLGVDAERAGNVVLAVDEACTNAIRHSYGGRRDRKLAITIRPNADFIEFELCDNGVPARADQVMRKELNPCDPSNLKPGGLGIPFIYKAFDEVAFVPGKARGNRVRMRLRRQE
ncbi:MAG TPA: ATP-binding protein [Candidatus Hydrogenedentes bacterium]|nr:ATP-binding protein [Candidatus Hydrogenedentota bacterium]